MMLLLVRTYTYVILLTLSMISCDIQASQKHGSNHLSIFLGSTEVGAHGTAATAGLDYEFRVTPSLGLGVVGEYASGDIDALTVLAVADVHLTDHFIVQLGPGIEHTSTHDTSVARIGVLYEFIHSKFTFSPQAHFDYHDGSDNAHVLGIAVGMSF